MSSVCHSGYSCIEPGVPVSSKYINIQKWAESDAEFVRSLTVNGSNCIGNDRRRLWRKPALVDSYSCRQMYVRSYTFSRKETVQEKTVKCLGKVKAKSTDLLCQPRSKRQWRRIDLVRLVQVWG
ncbi:hypothetical protein HPP92_006589 [Vanilla planifolia]|uniref:Uncharacterized protein n=1 Tax=Vanilla planifolia TaxID=51239 RepID=A0A835V7U6_VANPL|nr:hypothetical protein HPP92_006589 [Vanilla planifolia]